MYRTLLLISLLLAPGSLPAQAADEATLLLRRGREEVGKETFRVLAGRGRGLPGSTLAVTAEYPGRRPDVALTAMLSRTPAGEVTAFQFERSGGSDTTRVLGEVAGQRTTVRMTRGTIESARQYPASPGLVVLADSVHALLSQLGPLATAEGRRLAGLYPLTGRRITLVATLAPGDASGGRVVEVTGDLTATVSFDAAGRLRRVTLPASGITAVRAEP